MRKNFLIKVGGIIYWPAFTVALAWIGFELIFGEDAVDSWIDDLSDWVFWPIVAIIIAGLLGILLVWWGQRGGK